MERIHVEKLRNFIKAVFRKLGVPEEDADICSRVLIQSDLHGIESHGIGRLKMYYDRIKAGIQNPVTEIEKFSDRAAAAVWDGNHGMGHVIGHRAMETAMEKARQYGIGTVAVRNSTHFGICGYYAKMAAREDMIGLVFTNARPSIAPTLGVDPMLGTNPVCFGAPTNLPFPFLYDAAASITQRGKIEVLDREGKDTPAGWAIDGEGKPYTDTPGLLRDLVSKKAALLPLGGSEELLGGHKGYGLAVMVEILSAALQGGSFLHGLSGWEGEKRVPYRLGHFFLSMNISHYTDPESFKEITTRICTDLQKSREAPGNSRIYVAGEKEYENEKEIRSRGVPVNEELKKNIIIMQNELNLRQDESLF
ncbi:MAG: Ldh family oxidoreductase [Spirochaetia bacterium]